MWSVHTAGNCERAGIPTVVVSTKAFAHMGRQTAISNGLPGLPIVAAPHPFDYLTDQEMSVAASDMVDEVVATLTRPADELEILYRHSWLEQPENLAAACDLLQPALRGQQE